ncbi:Mnd1 family protein [Prunus dulcis]|uniref:Mnd1 family protein n=1 Tax=Prunus dulcis TaxID=3755 RepID=A0A4Y1QLZ6_PRUDU|nr:Mnd1 family protein [Prunus dulcis]
MRTLKELDKSGPKKCVISQSVKYVIQNLVDDDLVYFWSLPSTAGNQLRNVYSILESDLQSSKKRHAELVEQAEALNNHLTAVQRDHEVRSQIEERKIRIDAAYEDAKRKEKSLQDKNELKQKLRSFCFAFLEQLHPFALSMARVELGQPLFT